MLATLLFVLAPGVWTIDDNGPADFADLPEAVAAVSDGDILRLMPGNYTGTTIDKNLTLIGIEGGFFEYVAINQPGLVVDGSLGGPSTLTLKDMNVFGLVLTGLSDRVRIERANLFNVLVEDCPDVVFVGTGVAQSGFAPTALTVHNSSLHLIGSGVIGSHDPNTYNGNPALVLMDASEVHLSGSTIQGGNGVTHFIFNGIGGPAITVVAGTSNLVVRGSSTDVI
jgi:hypothetical protein